MPDSEGVDAALFEGLQALVDSAFPKRCNTCGRVYQAPGDFALRRNERQYNLQRRGSPFLR